MLQYGRDCQHLLLIGAYFIQCWCVVVLVHICLFNHPFLSAGGWGIQAEGWSYSWERRGEKNRVFCYCPIRGWQYVYIYIVYMWWKCVGFLCDTTFYLYYGSTFSVSVLIIYIWFMFYFFSFSLILLSLSFLVLFYFFPPFFFLSLLFVYCTVYYFCCPMRWHSYSLYSFSAVK